MNRQFAQSYKASSVQTASPGQLVLMLYDGALKFLQVAEAGFQETNVRTRNEQINNNLIKAQNILAELQTSLDMKVEGEFSKTMFQLYDFMIRQLQEANIRKAPEPIKVVDGMLRDIRDAWEEMLKKNSATAAAAQSAVPDGVPSKAPAEAKGKTGGSLDASA